MTVVSSACLSLHLNRCRGTRNVVFPRRQAAATFRCAMPLRALRGTLFGLLLPNACLGLRSAESSLPGEGAVQVPPLRNSVSGTGDTTSGSARSLAEAAVVPTSALATLRSKAREAATSAKVFSTESVGGFSNGSLSSADATVGNFAGHAHSKHVVVLLEQLAQLHDGRRGLSRSSRGRSWQVDPSIWNFLGPLLAVLVFGTVLALFCFCNSQRPPWTTMESVGIRLQGSRALAVDATGASSVDASQARRSGGATASSSKKVATRVKFGFRESYKPGEPTDTGGHKTSLMDSEESQILPGSEAGMTLAPSDVSLTDSRRSRASTADSNVSELWQDPTVGDSDSDDASTGKPTSSSNASMRRTGGSTKSAQQAVQRMATGR